MTSIATNSAATSALQTLRSLETELDRTQGRVASGRRISEAADNAAYWSIATTMRSDNKAVSAVADALGLGSALTDTAYTATGAIVNVLDEVKAKLVAASEPGVDKAKVQKELEQLKSQAVSITNSASFNGQNWLVTDAATNLRDDTELSTSVVSSFSRTKSGAVALDTLEVDLTRISMLNTGGGGILQKDPDPIFDELPAMVHDKYDPPGFEIRTFGGPVTFGAGDSVTFNLTVDASPQSGGTTYLVEIDKDTVDAALGTSTGTITSEKDLARVLNAAFTNAGAQAYASSYTPQAPYNAPPYNVPSTFTITTRETTGLVGSSIAVSGVTSTLALGEDLELSSTPTTDVDNRFESSTLSFPGEFTLVDGVELNFNFQINSSPRIYATIDRSMINSVLGKTTGTVSTADEFAEVIRTAIREDLSYDPGLEVTASGSEITFTPDQALYPGYGGQDASLSLSDIVSNLGWTLRYDLADIDITTSTHSLDEYIKGVDHMLANAIDSAANLGALQSRIDMQSEFAMTLMGTVDKGIGRLVDADMNEESTRLKALQTQQQLATQSLSIANSNSQSLLQLFN